MQPTDTRLPVTRSGGDVAQARLDAAEARHLAREPEIASLSRRAATW